MKNSLSKILAVTVTVASVMFLGVSIAARYGHPEPTGEMSSPALKEYTFTKNPGVNVTWDVKRRTGDKADVVKGAKTSYEAILKAYQDLDKRMKEESSAASTELQKLKDAAGELARFKTNQELDEKAMEARIVELRQLAVRYQADLLKKSEELQALSVQSKTIRDETARRRTDVIRLQSELEEARTDLFRLNEQIRSLTDQMVRLELDNQDLQVRKTQLESQLSP